MRSSTYVPCANKVILEGNDPGVAPFFYAIAYWKAMIMTE